MFLFFHLRKYITHFGAIGALFFSANPAWPCDFLATDSGFDSCLDNNFTNNKLSNPPLEPQKPDYIPEFEPPISFKIHGEIELNDAFTHIRVKKKGD